MNSTQGNFDIGSGLKLQYTIDNFAHPWDTPQSVVLIHGLAESGEAWRAWVPTLARRYRVIRLDMRGFGRSTPVAQDHPWSLDLLAGDVARLIDEVVQGPAHVVGAKIGAAVSARFAASYPGKIKSLTLIGLPVRGPKKSLGEDPAKIGSLAWARTSMRARLGEDAAPEMLEYWSQMMAKTALSTQVGFMHAVGSFDVRADLPRIVCPVLLLNSDSKVHPLSETDEWRAMLRNSELVAVPGLGFHAAAVRPDFCAKTTLDFFVRHDAERQDSGFGIQNSEQARR